MDRGNEIQIVGWPEDDKKGQELLNAGFAFQGICSCHGLTERLKARFGPCDVWYTERNGDPIGMVCPEGTPHEKLPSVAMEYLAFEWIKPEDDFGGGVVPAIYAIVK